MIARCIGKAHVEICVMEDGSDHVLGKGSYGKVYLLGYPLRMDMNLLSMESSSRG